MAERPNLVLIITDHWRGDCLGRTSRGVVETPHLDSMSAKGATFTHAYTPSASCTPARRSLMTGQTPYTQGMVGYQDGVPWDYDVTFAGELSRAGYQTINIGKTHFVPDRKHLGFENLIVPADYSDWLAAQPGIDVDKNAHGVPGNSWVARPSHLPERMMQSTWLTSRALEFLQRRDPTRPFFLCLSFDGPHPPWTPPEIYYDMYINRELPAPAIGDWAHVHRDAADVPPDVNAWRAVLPEHVIHRARAAYYGFLSYLDAQVGRLMDVLQRGGHLRNTFLLMTSDHGEMLGDHYLWRKTYGYEASSRVPFVAAWPAAWGWKQNREFEQVVGWEDIMPTFLEVAGAPVPETVEGHSIVPLLSGDAADWREYYHTEHSPCYHPENAHQTLTDGRWKYVWNPINGVEQLFHLAVDPDELHDLAGSPESKEVLAMWRQRMVAELAGRVEGLSDGTQLIPGPVPVWHGAGGTRNELHLG